MWPPTENETVGRTPARIERAGKAHNKFPTPGPPRRKLVVCLPCALYPGRSSSNRFVFCGGPHGALRGELRPGRAAARGGDRAGGGREGVEGTVQRHGHHRLETALREDDGHQVRRCGWKGDPRCEAEVRAG